MEPSFRHRPDWIEISIRSDPSTHEAVSAFLVETLGCDGVVTDASSGPILKAYLPAGTVEEGLGPRIEGFLAGLQGWFPETEPASWRLARIRDPDWHTAWREHFRPEQVTPGLMIVPAWEPAPRDVSGRVLRMDPGPAFGTGQHATTRMCLQALEEQAPRGSWSLLDVGTGSGILAMYGALLGASPVEGVDVDEEALRWGQWNLSLNGLTGSVRLSSDPPEAWKGPFTVVTANLTLDVILGLLPQFSKQVNPAGTLVLSGLLQEQVSPVMSVLHMAGFEVTRELGREEWVCLTARRSEETIQGENPP